MVQTDPAISTVARSLALLDTRGGRQAQYTARFATFKSWNRVKIQEDDLAAKNNAQSCCGLGQLDARKSDATANDCGARRWMYCKHRIRGG
jgi:hypothetical protein